METEHKESAGRIKHPHVDADTLGRRIERIARVVNQGVLQISGKNPLHPRRVVGERRLAGLMAKARPALADPVRSAVVVM